MAKFDNVQVGDKVWSTVYGWGEVYDVSKGVRYGVKAKFKYSNGSWVTESYTFSGMNCTEDYYPELFWNGFHIPTEDEDRQPFNVTKFIKDNFDRRYFVRGARNWRIVYSHVDSKLLYNYVDDYDVIPSVYVNAKKGEDYKKSLIEILNKNNVTAEQIKKAYEELGWL